MKKEKTSIVVIAVGFALLAFVFNTIALYIVAAVIAFCGLISPKIRKIILQVWGKIGGVLGWVNTRIILSVLFYLILTPLALLRRLLAKNERTFKSENNESYYFERNHTFTKPDVENPW